MGRRRGKNGVQTEYPTDTKSLTAIQTEAHWENCNWSHIVKNVKCKLQRKKNLNCKMEDKIQCWQVQWIVGSGGEDGWGGKQPQPYKCSMGSGWAVTTTGKDLVFNRDIYKKLMVYFQQSNKNTNNAKNYGKCRPPQNTLSSHHLKTDTAQWIRFLACMQFSSPRKTQQNKGRQRRTRMIKGMKWVLIKELNRHGFSSLEDKQSRYYQRDPW